MGWAGAFRQQKHIGMAPGPAGLTLAWHQRTPTRPLQVHGVAAGSDNHTRQSRAFSGSALASLLEQAMPWLPRHCREVVCVLPAAEASIQYFPFTPDLPDLLVARELETDAGYYLPFPLQNCCYDFRYVPETRGAAEAVLQVAALPGDVVQQYHSACAAAGLRLLKLGLGEDYIGQLWHNLCRQNAASLQDNRMLALCCLEYTGISWCVVWQGISVSHARYVLSAPVQQPGELEAVLPWLQQQQRACVQNYGAERLAGCLLYGEVSLLPDVAGVLQQGLMVPLWPAASLFSAYYTACQDKEAADRHCYMTALAATLGAADAAF